MCLYLAYLILALYNSSLEPRSIIKTVTIMVSDIKIA